MIYDEMRRQAKSLLDECNGIVAKAAEGKRGFSDDERSTMTSRQKEAQQLLEDATQAENVYRMSMGLPGTAPASVATEPAATPAAKSGFRNLGEFFKAVSDVAIHQTRDSRLFEQRGATGMNESISSEGGFLIPPEFVDGLIKKTYDASVLTSMVRKLPVGPQFNGIRIPFVDETSRVDGSRLGGVQAYWASEAGILTASKPALGQFALDLQKLIALCYVTDELLMDSTALGGFLPDAFAQELAFKSDAGIYYGDGVGKPLGLLNSPALVSVAAEAAQTAATVNYQNVIKMWSRLWPRSQQNAVWLVNPDVQPTMFSMAFPNAAGTYPAYMPANILTGSPYSTLFGRPVIPIEYASTVGTVGDIMLVDLNEYLLIDKGEPKADTSIHVKFTTDEMAFRFVYRVNGAPTWKSALTPHKGSNTLSPYIALAAR